MEDSLTLNCFEGKILLINIVCDDRVRTVKLKTNQPVTGFLAADAVLVRQWHWLLIYAMFHCVFGAARWLRSKSG